MSKYGTLAVALCALAVGVLSVIGGQLNQRAADRKVCAVTINENAAARGLLDDLIKASPNVSKADAAKADAIAIRRFPNHC